MTTWTFPSSSGPGEYTVLLQDDGLIRCDCRGYLIKREGKPRQCRHVEDVIKKHQLISEQRGDFVFVTGVGAVSVEIKPRVDHTQRYHDAHDMGYIEPMLASAMTKRAKNEPWETTLQPYQTDDWCAEIKYDGHRVVLATLNGVYSWSRPRPGEGSIGKVRQLPEHIRREAEANLPDDATFDGEEITGATGKSWEVTRLDRQQDKTLVLFDILQFEGQKLLDKPFAVRRQILEAAIAGCDPKRIRLAESVPPTATEIKRLWDAGAEGLILKRRTSIYRPGWRSPDWLKIKMEFYVKAQVVGFEAAKNGPYSKVKLISTESVETTVKTKDNHWLREFAKDPQKYLGQWLVIKHYGPTPDGKYRGPIVWDHWAGEGE